MTRVWHEGVCLVPHAITPRLLHEFFDRAASKWPDRTAVEVPPGAGRPERRRVTYAELRRQAHVLCRILHPFVAKECVVGILLPRSSEVLYSAQLAVLKAGAAYICIDPLFPDEQVRDILQDAEPVALLTDAAGLERARNTGWNAGNLIDARAEINRIHGPVDAPLPAPWLTPESLAYMIYTSGTTGRPKGVMIKHGSVVHLVAANLEVFGLTSEDRVAQNSSSSYDSSVEEIWLALSAGSTLVAMDDDAVRLGPDLVPWLRRERIMVFCPSPTLLRTTGCSDPETALPDLRFVYLGGEALTQDIADRWARGRLLVNGYGPTECTVTCTRTAISAGEPVSIGVPLPGNRAWVLDEALEEVSNGETGELCIGGIGLARGYHNRPDITARKFIDHPEFGRIYRTGDLVHRSPTGAFVYEGRIDAQVKIRGYRIELEAIEARLAECEGVLEAACVVQGEGTHQFLVGFIVPEHAQAPPSLDKVKLALGRVLPIYMVPSRLGVLSELPRSTSRKLDRKALPLLDHLERDKGRPSVAPRNALEEQIASAFSRVLETRGIVSVTDCFFSHLGGDSLAAATVISLLREHPATASLTVRDLYESRTVAELAKRAQAFEQLDDATDDEPSPAGRWPVLVTFAQALWLLTGLATGALLSYFVSFWALPFLVARLGLVRFLLLEPFLLFAGLTVYTAAALMLVVLLKKILIGRYRPLRAPVWGGFYLRNWMVRRAASVLPWRLFEGTAFQNAALRALGARIGRRVHLHRGVHLSLLQGGWDLLEVGDDVTVSQDAAIRLVELDDGHMVVGPVTLGTGSTLDIRAGVGPHTCLEPDAYLTALSSLPCGGRIPRGERWDGVPAAPAGDAPPRPVVQDSGAEVPPAVWSLTLVLARLALGLVSTLPFQAIAITLAVAYGVQGGDIVTWMSDPAVSGTALVVAVAIAVLNLPLTLAIEALISKAMGRVPQGVISRWSLAYVRVWLKAELMDEASRWLSSSLLWPVWLRLAGMKVGRGCEISTVIDTVPELVEIGPETFFADRIYLGGPRIHRGTVAIEPVRLGTNVFLGNHVVIPAGQSLPDNVLLGVCTVAQEGEIESGTSWFGHPPFVLPRREVIECDRRLTHEPSRIRYGNRVFWELLRFVLPAAPALTLLVWFALLDRAAASTPWPFFLAVIVPLLTGASASFLCLLVLGLKWMLLGRVHPGQHPLWSCWCSRWDFFYVAWAFYARRILSMLEGTLLLAWYLRAMGARIGRRVVLGSPFAQVVDPDMLQIGDDATVDCLLQAHTFEDRVLKIDRVRIGRGATVGSNTVLLYGTDIGERTGVGPHSVVMKRETLLPRRSYTGCPTRGEKRSISPLNTLNKIDRENADPHTQRSPLQWTTDHVRHAIGGRAQAAGLELKGSRGTHRRPV